MTEKRLNECQILVVGVNRLALCFLTSLSTIKKDGVQWLDDPILRNPELFDPTGELRTEILATESVRPLPLKSDIFELAPERFDCLVVVAESASHVRMRTWNEYCHLHDKSMFPAGLEGDLEGARAK